jgi:protein-disulfide isomerase
MKRTFGYDPKITWRIVGIRPSAAAGIADVIISINQQPAQHLYVSADGKRAIIGEMTPFGADPFAAARVRLAKAAGTDRGPANAAVTLVIFSDLQCADCKASEPVLDKLATDFPQVRQVFLPVPLPVHPWSLIAAKYADCVGRANKAAFWTYVSAVFNAQDIINTDPAGQLKALAVKAGADVAKVSTCADAPDTQARIDASLALSQAIELDVDQVPTTFLNGRKVLNPASVPYENLKTLVAFEIAHAGK